MRSRRPARPAAMSAPSALPLRHARRLARRPGAAVAVVALLAVVLGTGAGAAAAGPSSIEVFGWRPVGGSGKTGAADASSQRDDRTATATDPTVTTPTATTLDPAEAVEPDPGAVDPAQMAAEVVAATNAQRTAAGLPELAVSSCATEQVTGRVAQLVETNTFEHPPLEPVLAACAVSGAGENLAKGYLDGTGVVDGWMNSENHKANLLGDWTETGVSCQLRSDGQWLCGAVYTRA